MNTVGHWSVCRVFTLFSLLCVPHVRSYMAYIERRFNFASCSAHLARPPIHARWLFAVLGGRPLRSRDEILGNICSYYVCLPTMCRLEVGYKRYWPIKVILQYHRIFFRRPSLTVSKFRATLAYTWVHVVHFFWSSIHVQLLAALAGESLSSQVDTPHG